MTSENLNLLIGLGQLILALLVFLNIDREYVKKHIPNIRIRSTAIYILVIGGFAFSGYGFYLANKRPKVVEKVVEKSVDRIVEKPVEKIVEKVVPAKCPKPLECPKAQAALVVPAGSNITATTNAPDSMAAGINTGTMIKGDAPPEFSLTPVSENIQSGAVFRSRYKLNVVTKRTITLQITARASSLVETIDFEKEPPPPPPPGQPGPGGDALGPMMVKPAWQGVATASVSNITTGTYYVTVSSNRAEKIKIDLAY